MKQTLFFIFCSSYLSINAQTSINTSGQSSSNATGSITASIGQIGYTKHSSSNGSVSLGVQQVYSLTPLGIENPEIQLKASVFPNPTANTIELLIDLDLINLTYTLYDNQGKVLNSSNIQQKQTHLNLESFNSGIYFLKITQGNKELQSFKIEKN